MADVVQWTIDKFWGELQNLENLAHALKSDLDTDKTQLTSLYSQTRKDANTVRAAQNQSLLQPLIHQNSVLRMQYADLVGKFNRAVAAGSDLLKHAGYSTPTLTGLGQVPLIVGGSIVALLIVTIGTYETVRIATDAQRTATKAIAARVASGNATEADLEALRKKVGAATGDPFGIGKLVPVLGFVALIAFGPQLMRMFQNRKAVAA